MEKEVKIRLPKGKEVELLDTSIKDGHIVVKYSLKEEFIPQHGDIIFVKSGDDTFIEVFDCYKDDCIWCSCYLSLRTDSFRNKKGYISKSEIDEISLAVTAEIVLLFYAIKEKGLIFNDETREVEKIRWRAEPYSQKAKELFKSNA